MPPEGRRSPGASGGKSASGTPDAEAWSGPERRAGKQALARRA